MAAKKVAAKAKTKTKPLISRGQDTRTQVKAVRVGGPKRRERVRKVETDPAKKAKALAKMAERLDRHAAKCSRIAAKRRTQAAKLATKTLAKPKCRYSPKLQAALAEIAKLGQVVEVSQDDKAFKKKLKKVKNVDEAAAIITGEAPDSMKVVESAEDTAEALKVVAAVLKGEFK